MPQTALRQRLVDLTASIADRPLDAALDTWLNAVHCAGSASFDGLVATCRPAGWRVCPPGSAHRPSVADGRALLLYLLPEGRIDFTATAQQAPASENRP